MQPSGPMKEEVGSEENESKLLAWIEHYPAWVIALTGTLLHGVVYFIPNQFQLFAPRTLPFMKVDELAGFHPWAVWIYLSVYFLDFVAFVSLKRRRRFLAAFFTTILIAATVHLFYPVILPREPWVVSPDTWWLNAKAMALLRRMDNPVSCLPSLHVASAYIGVLMLYAENRKRALWLLPWASAIALSTMMTKQHYAVDVVTGLFLAISVAWLYLVVLARPGSQGTPAPQSR